MTPDGSGEDLFLRAGSTLNKGESTHRFDCNTVGPVPAASGYGSRTLTQSAAHVLNGSKENASALSSLNEKRHVKSGDSCLRGLSEIEVGVPRSSKNSSNPQSVKDGALKRQKAFNSMPESSCFTGNTASVVPEEKARGTEIASFT